MLSVGAWRNLPVPIDDQGTAEFHPERAYDLGTKRQILTTSTRSPRRKGGGCYISIVRACAPRSWDSIDRSVREAAAKVSAIFSALFG